jgi:hypothetical protein
MYKSTVLHASCCCKLLIINCLLSASHLTLTTSVSDDFFTLALALTLTITCTITISLVSGMIFFNAGARDDSVSTNFQSHFGAISSILMSAMFGPAQVVLLEFPLKRPMFMREFATGTCTYMDIQSALMIVTRPSLLNIPVALFDIHIFIHMHICVCV